MVAERRPWEGQETVVQGGLLTAVPAAAGQETGREPESNLVKLEAIRKQQAESHSRLFGSVGAGFAAFSGGEIVSLIHLQEGGDVTPQMVWTRASWSVACSS